MRPEALKRLQFPEREISSNREFPKQEKYKKTEIRTTGKLLNVEMVGPRVSA